MKVSVPASKTRKLIKTLAAERILVLDGAMGTMIQSLGLDEDAATRKLIAAAVAAEQVLDLVDRGVTDFHFYTMNRADLVYAVCHLLGLRPSHEPTALPLAVVERAGVRGVG